jgi:APA family basic amino acid/polyamine antiporter
MQPEPALERRLGTADAVVVGLGAMLGAGVFAALGPAAAAAGSLLLLSLAVAAVVAACNGLSSAALAARHPASGGTYVYARERLGPGWGWQAGWAFVVGKTASCAAMALVFGSYAVPAAPRAAAAGAVLVLTAVLLGGIGQTLRVTRVLVAVVLAALGLVVVCALTGGTASTAGLTVTAGITPGGVLEAAGLLFFAFAGYARITTLGEEVRDPERTIPRAVPLALGLVLALYAVVAVAALAAVGPAGLATAEAPLAAVVEAGDRSALAPLVRAGAAVAALGVLLSLLAGVGRTVLAMGRTGDLPTGLAAVSVRTRVPYRAQLAVSAVVLAVVLTVDVRGAIGFSSLAVLGYYAITNAAALRLRPEERRLPPAVAAAGLAGCLLLGLSLPAGSVLSGILVLAVGALAGAARRATLRRRDRGTSA